jgi:hypothetical protein
MEAWVSTVRHSGQPRQFRRSLMMVALTLGATVAMLAIPAPASADDPWIIPPNGWCYNNWYVFGTNHGQVQQAYGPIKHFSNQTTQTATWTESIQVNFTFSSSYTTQTSFSGGFDLGIIKDSVDYHTSTTTSWTISVNKTTGFSIPVPPGVTMYAEYGSYGLSTDGTYNQEQFECGTYNYDSVTSGAVTGYSLTSEGWTLWQA